MSKVVAHRVFCPHSNEQCSWYRWVTNSDDVIVHPLYGLKRVGDIETLDIMQHRCDLHAQSMRRMELVHDSFRKLNLPSGSRDKAQRDIVPTRPGSFLEIGGGV